MRIQLVILMGLALGGTERATGQASDFGQTILGKNAPLTLKLKDLDSNWRVFKAGSNSLMGMMSVLAPGAGNCYTKGETVTAGGTVFLIVYKADAPDMTSLFGGGGGGGLPKAQKLSAETTLRLSLLNLQATSELEGIHAFQLKDEIAGGEKAANSLQSGLDAAAKAVKVPDTAATTKNIRLARGVRAPNFAVKDAKGNNVSLASYAGKVVVLDFWATWCGPCQESLPSTNEVAAKYKKQGVVFLAVNVWDEKKEFNKWLPAHKTLSSLQFAIDPAAQPKDIASKLYKVAGIPTQYVIDRKGRVFGSIEGYGGDDKELVKTINAALASG